MNDTNRTTDERASHTPGPWRIQQESVDTQWHIITAAGGRIMANIHIETGNAMDAANARLIAAAPELLEALKRLARTYVSTMESGRDRIIALGGDCDPVDVMERGDPYLRIAKEAIAKAEGRS